MTTIKAVIEEEYARLKGLVEYYQSNPRHTLRMERTKANLSEIEKYMNIEAYIGIANQVITDDIGMSASAIVDRHINWEELCDVYNSADTPMMMVLRRVLG